METIWQTGAAVAVALLAVAWLVRRAWRTLAPPPGGGGCGGGCGCRGRLEKKN